MSETATLEINISPDIGSYEHTIVGDTIVFVKISPDEDSYDMFADEDGNGQILSFNSRHSNFIGYDKEEKIQDLLDNHEAVPLSYFEHGRCLWFVADSKTPAGVEFVWDGREFAGLWIPDEDVFENIGDVSGDERKEKLRAYAAAVVEQYTQWCNGEIYGYDVVTYYLKRDSDGDPIVDFDDYDDNEIKLDEESLWGLYGYEYAETEAAATARRLVHFGASKPV
jgi:hypothetical protein